MTPFIRKRFPYRKGIGVVDFENSDRRATHWRLSPKPWSLPFKVLSPNIDSWMKKACEVRSDRVQSSDVGTFAQIA